MLNFLIDTRVVKEKWETFFHTCKTHFNISTLGRDTVFLFTVQSYQKWTTRFGVKLITLIFLIGEMLEKFLLRSDYIFGLSLMPGIQWSKNFSTLTSRFEGQVPTACSHHGPSAKWSVYLIFTSAVASRLVISCTGYCVEGVAISVH